MRGVFACALAGLALGVGAGAASADCSVGQVVELPTTIVNMQAMTDAKINGKDVRFVIDSGAFWSVISPGSARVLSLSVEPLPGWIMQGINGDVGMSLATVKTFTISGVDIPHIQFVVGGSEVGGTGVIGQNLLGLFDAEYDLPHGAVRLMKSKGCGKANMAYWTAGTGKPYAVVTLDDTDPSNRQTVGTVYLNGARIKATFDTGAFDSVLSMAAAARAGITPKSPGVEPGGMIVGFGRKEVRTWIAPFDSFKVGEGEEIHHGRIRFGELTGDTDMLIGADFFIAHRIYVSRATNRLFLTYEGGPVFNLNAKFRNESGSTLTEAAPAKDPTTAEGYSRSGAVRLARHDKDGAIADFDKAIELAPAEPRYRLQRAGALRAAGRDKAAMADIEKALVLDPNSVEARLIHAAMQLDADDFTEASVIADLEAADRAAAPAADERLDLGELYSEASAPARAVPQFDLWIRNHGDDVRRPSALNDRCWARALDGKELRLALADCNAALGKRPGSPSILDSRALVELRMGDLDTAMRDYDAVLAKEPKTAWSLYGRGIVKQRRGDAAGAKADITAAVAISPKLPERAKALGITP